MNEHKHPHGEFCDDCRPILEVDYGAGEQFWRHWSSQTVPYMDGRDVRFKVLSKKAPLAGKPAYHFVALREFSDGTKETFGQGYFGEDALLVSFVMGIELTLKSVVRRPDSMFFDLIDFRGCDTLDKYEYKVREGTTFKVWKGEPGGGS